MVGKHDKTPQLSINWYSFRKVYQFGAWIVHFIRANWLGFNREGILGLFFRNRSAISSDPKKVGLLLLKHIYNLSDEAIVDRWIENPYWQYFSGEKVFQTQKPFDPTEFIHFRNRIGKEGAEKLLKVSIQLFGKEAQEKEV